MMNQDETAVDCGGKLCPACGNGLGCVVPGDCAGGQCLGGTCDSILSSCLAILTAHPAAASGLYTIDPDGAGAITAFSAYCDMAFDGGGWTLVLSTANGAAPDTLSAAGDPAVGTGTQSWAGTAAIGALAGTSTQVHLRTSGNTTDRFVTSNAGSPPIANLAAGKLLNAGYALGAAILADFTGPFATAEFLPFSCDVNANAALPNIYWACGNGEGLHLVTNNSRWKWLAGDTSQNESMELYVRLVR